MDLVPTIDDRPKERPLTPHQKGWLSDKIVAITIHIYFLRLPSCQQSISQYPSLIPPIW